MVGTMTTRRMGIILVLLLVSAAAATACNYTYTVIDTEGREVQITEGERTTLTHGESYVLRMEYHENHRNCTVSPDETLYLVDGARWRLDRATQPLVLTGTPEWIQPTSRTHRGEFTFTAAAIGEWMFEVVRVCDRGGYHGAFFLEVRS
jgi:hypothetical protein